MTGQGTSPSLFEILSLPEPQALPVTLSQSDIQKAYKQALLLNHPDKHPSSKDGTEQNGMAPTIDQIKLAYLTLSSPTERATYVQKLLLSRQHDASTSNKDAAKLDGLEIVDLEDMQFEKSTGTYFRPCRCGRARSYCVTEAQLEERADTGEVRIGCDGCSLQVLIEFGVIDDVID